MPKGVLAVEPGHEDIGAVWTAEQRIRLEMQARLLDALDCREGKP